MLHFAVRDTGIGIPADKLAAIFDSFTQADGSTTRQYGGTGLGLAISRQLVEMMGGRIWVESEVGRGTVFHFTVRFALDDFSSAAAMPAAVSPVLPAADRPLRVLLAEDNAINQMLAVRMLEKHGHTVVVAADGREALDALERERFDLLLTDVQMPGMGGLELTTILRAREAESGEHLPIIAMTAHAMKGDRDAFLEAGMDGYVPKPIRTEELYNAIRLALPVLLSAERGATSDGFNKMYRMNRMEGHEDRVTQAPSPHPSHPAHPVKAVGCRDDVFDRAALLDYLGGERELLDCVVDRFLAECPRLLGAVEDAVVRGDGAELERAAHALKGTVGNFHAAAAVDAAMRLERMGRDGDLRHAETALAALEQELERLKPALAALRVGVT